MLLFRGACQGINGPKRSISALFPQGGFGGRAGPFQRVRRSSLAHYRRQADFPFLILLRHLYELPVHVRSHRRRQLVQVPPVKHSAKSEVSHSEGLSRSSTKAKGAALHCPCGNLPAFQERHVLNFGYMEVPDS